MRNIELFEASSQNQARVEKSCDVWIQRFGGFRMPQSHTRGTVGFWKCGDLQTPSVEDIAMF